MAVALHEAELYARLDAAIAAAGGSQDAWARAAGLPASYVSEVRGGKRPFSARLLAALRVRRVVSFEDMGEAGDASAPGALVAALTAKDRQTLLWLRQDGTPRKRTEADPSGWRPLREDLKRLQAMRLAVDGLDGWTATDAGQETRAALVEKEGDAP
ncbi:hypothetical protein [Roseomonas populi]|uniref:XRE family transcriptional regulator n=1 Tax=Roseomonas populi TaxID=3121582 RepID=A0ABT1X205_9PROT|nr:hypothetical protein [Roseomonas pecuniae]MCR0981826.1 hypothetical protein [Roseomonas pecuniae]